MTLVKTLDHRKVNGRVVWNCRGYGDLGNAIEIIEDIEGIDIPATIDYLRSKGGYRDCEILVNVDPQFHSFWSANLTIGLYSMRVVGTCKRTC